MALRRRRWQAAGTTLRLERGAGDWKLGGGGAGAEQAIDADRYRRPAPLRHLLPLNGEGNRACVAGAHFFFLAPEPPPLPPPPFRSGKGSSGPLPPDNNLLLLAAFFLVAISRGLLNSSGTPRVDISHHRIVGKSRKSGVRPFYGSSLANRSSLVKADASGHRRRASRRGRGAACSVVRAAARLPVRS